MPSDEAQDRAYLIYAYQISLSLLHSEDTPATTPGAQPAHGRHPPPRVQPRPGLSACADPLGTLQIHKCIFVYPIPAIQRVLARSS
ncbi:hypothetical protein NWF32_26900 [Pseudomonas qingdaonensis]|nr:hypothetical protein [Pseudomonas qingdaonensis]